MCTSFSLSVSLTRAFAIKQPSSSTINKMAISTAQIVPHILCCVVHSHKIGGEANFSAKSYIAAGARVNAHLNLFLVSDCHSFVRPSPRMTPTQAMLSAMRRAQGFGGFQICVQCSFRLTRASTCTLYALDRCVHWQRRKTEKKIAGNFSLIRARITKEMKIAKW